MFFIGQRRSEIRTNCGRPELTGRILPRAVSVTAALLLLALIASVSPAQTDNIQQQLERAAGLIRDQRLAEAETELDTVLKATPNNAQAVNLLGTIRAQQGKLDEAENLLLRSARIDPAFVGVHMNLAFLYMLKNAPDKPISDLKQG